MTTSAPFQAGDKVLCTDDTFPACAIEFFNSLPKIGEVYTVTDCGITRNIVTRRLEWSVGLAEVPCLPDQSGKANYFAHWRFERISLERAEALKLMKSKPKA